MREWRIHLGAHKTATTHLQEVLALKRQLLVDRGVDFIPNEGLRRSGFAQALRAKPWAARVPGFRGRRLGRLVETCIEPLRAGPERVILSEENLLGGLHCAHGAPVYPGAGSAVAQFRSLSGDSKVLFFLSIRSFDALLPSAYAQALRIAPARPGGFGAIRRAVLARPPSWADLVRRIRAMAPDVPLVVWRQEDYRAHAEEVLSVLCGGRLSPLPAVADPLWTRTPSADAVRAAEALARPMPVAERRERVGAIYAEARGEPFRPFSREERDLFRRRYEHDLDSLAGTDKVTLLRFD